MNFILDTEIGEQISSTNTTYRWAVKPNSDAKTLLAAMVKRQPVPLVLWYEHTENGAVVETQALRELDRDNDADLRLIKGYGA
jgi:hypothetical protein